MIFISLYQSVRTVFDNAQKYLSGIIPHVPYYLGNTCSHFIINMSFLLNCCLYACGLGMN